MRTPRAVFPAQRVNRLLSGLIVAAFIKPDSRVEGVHFVEEAWARHKAGSPLVVISNHASYADSHIIERLLTRAGFGEMARRLYHVAGQKTFRTPWRRFFTAGINTIKVFQGTAKEPLALRQRQALESLKAFRRLVSTNPVLLFPEGTRTRTGRMGPVIPALVRYLRGNLVLPLALQGSEKMLGVGFWWPKPSTIVLRAGSPFIAEPDASGDKRREMEAYARRIIQLLDPPYRPL